LAVAARGGDQAAFAALMRRHKAWLYQFIRRYIADRDDAYDILQESFVSTWGALARYDPERPFRSLAQAHCAQQMPRSRPSQ
jgi:RNA polymerase sigma-70 factor (ECF subfamily)